MATFQQLTDATIGVSAHAWSPDGSEVAFAPNSNELRIADAKTLETKHSLKEHDMLISAIDWHPQSNYIVTCAHDRNAFVWSFDDGEKKWKPSLVILRIERAALDCRWSLDGQKFAVASSAKCVPVCYYESDNNWYVQAYAENVFDEFTWDGYNANGGILPSHFFGPMRPLTMGVRAGMSWD